MKALAKKIGIGLAVLLVGLLAFIATRPDTFHLERSAQISAPPEVVFGLINDFHNWNVWSPWDKIDPNLKRTFDGPAKGAGAVYSWVGNNDVGEGRMTIEDSKPSERIGIKLEFIKPFEATNQTVFTIVPAEGGSWVTWAMDGKNNFVSKAFGLLMDMDSMVGKDFEKGLASLNTAAQAEVKKPKSAATSGSPRLPG
ncbi:MAG: SRPBCC family protein [Actinomycetota bacterium]